MWSDKPTLEDLQYFLEFQVPSQWAPMFNELPLGHQRKRASCPSLQFSFMGPKVHVNSTQVIFLCLSHPPHPEDTKGKIEGVKFSNLTSLTVLHSGAFSSRFGFGTHMWSPTNWLGINMPIIIQKNGELIVCMWGLLPWSFAISLNCYHDRH